ncbi:MAG: amino acid racemase [Spirochaetales bacterium]|nr:amino acid racemase [Spirochaetales bacterium]
MSSLIIIGGGVGPMAGLELHRKIILNTNAPNGDSDHLPILHLSFSSYIPDRTEFLLKNETTNPGIKMAEIVAKSCKSYSSQFDRFIIGVPCNTFHAKPIFNAFKRRLSNKITFNTEIIIINMLDETIKDLQNEYSEGSRIGLLSTTGTRKSLVWKNHLTKAGYIPVELPYEKQEKVHNLIYNTEWGLKSYSPPTTKARKELNSFIEELGNIGAEKIVLGCTELPLAISQREKNIPVIDPVKSMAKAMLNEYFKQAHI